jgi:phenylacetate-coenzyme A ligase PaaK-like adenylate-forming protein
MILNGFLEKIILPTGDQILGTVFMKSLEEWRSIQMLSEAELDSLQKYKLHALLTHAVSNIPFYKSLDKQKKIYISL